MIVNGPITISESQPRHLYKIPGGTIIAKKMIPASFLDSSSFATRAEVDVVSLVSESSSGSFFGVILVTAGRRESRAEHLAATFSITS